MTDYEIFKEGTIRSLREVMVEDPTEQGIKFLFNNKNNKMSWGEFKNEFLIPLREDDIDEDEFEKAKALLVKEEIIKPRLLVSLPYTLGSIPSIRDKVGGLVNGLRTIGDLLEGVEYEFSDRQNRQMRKSFDIIREGTWHNFSFNYKHLCYYFNDIDAKLKEIKRNYRW